MAPPPPPQSASPPPPPPLWWQSGLLCAGGAAGGANYRQQRFTVHLPAAVLANASQVYAHVYVVAAGANGAAGRWTVKRCWR